MKSIEIEGKEYNLDVSLCIGTCNVSVEESHIMLEHELHPLIAAFHVW